MSSKVRPKVSLRASLQLGLRVKIRARLRVLIRSEYWVGVVAKWRSNRGSGCC